MEGESVYVPPGLNLLVNVNSTPELQLVMVEGSIIFPSDPNPNHERYFDANWIYIHRGYMEVGTEEHPYTSQLTITMHGGLYDPYLPIYGNKVIGVRYGVLDMHGVTRTPTWTSLNHTVDANATEITLIEAVDWQVGEEIVIAPSSFCSRCAQKNKIKAIDNSNPDKPVITLETRLNQRRFAESNTFYGNETIEMRAEVGLLTRNVKFRGDPETSRRNKYGATIFLHSTGDDSVIGRISNIELTDVG